MLLLIFLVLCAATGMPWWVYVIGIVVWWITADWST